MAGWAEVQYLARIPARRADVWNYHCQPGRVTIRRLDRLEFNSTIRDLLGVVAQPA
jgi:hypothetical protein